MNSTELDKNKWAEEFVISFGSALPISEHIKLFQDRMNQEINRLWQRSIFLATFLVLIFTGYGMLVSKLLENELSQVRLVHAICLGISVIGIVLSLLWTMMAKGSKAWQEKYELAFFEFMKREIKSRNLTVSFSLSQGLGNGYLPPVRKNKFYNCLFSTKAGAYSPSKINVMIGIVSQVIWMVIFSIHAYVLRDSWGFWIANIIILIALVSWITNACRSGVIQKAQDKKKSEENKKAEVAWSVFVDKFDYWRSLLFSVKRTKKFCVRYFSVSVWTVIYIVLIVGLCLLACSVCEKTFLKDTQIPVNFIIKKSFILLNN